MPSRVRRFSGDFLPFLLGDAFPARLATLRAAQLPECHGSGILTFIGLRFWLYVLANGNLERLVREYVDIAGHSRALLHIALGYARVRTGINIRWGRRINMRRFAVLGALAAVGVCLGAGCSEMQQPPMNST